jgi:hypothetical protein
MTQKRCTKEVFDGWEDTDRCLLDKGHGGPHNYLNPGEDLKLKIRFRSNQAD